MSRLAHLLQIDDGSPATAITLVTADGLPAWLGQQSERTRVLLAAQGFTGKADTVAIVAGDAAADWWAVAGVADRHDPFALAALAEKLPEGRYRLQADADGASIRFGDGTHGKVPLDGWLLGQHRFDRYRKGGGAAGTVTGKRVLLTRDPAAMAAALAMADATALVRDLVDTPAADMGPAELAEAVLAHARPHKAHVAVVTGEALLTQGFPAVHAVGRAATAAPRVIDMTWGDAAHPKLTLVGKGVTFDSGGLNIKPGSGMALMKKDMGGAAHALALAQLVMQAGLKVRLRLIIPAVENAISGNAMRPGDVLATRAGKTVEVTNTDAEGRLILADALALAVEDKPALLLDFATLTGAARVALGPQLPAMFANDAALGREWQALGLATGDPVWELPLWDGYDDMLKSGVADMQNAPEGGFAGAITAALFLRRFVPADVPWAHLDTFAWNPSPKPGRPKGGAALGLRSAWALVKARFA
ncbi:MAG: leucyl aminopeptidase family protein [Sphingomonadales bacterium]|jgi:leucyl aminopeptidase